MMKKLFTLLFLLSFPTIVDANIMVERSRQYTPTVERLLLKYWESIPMKEIIWGQIEQESMWKPYAKLETSRELGRGFGQITIAYDAQGRERFNIFREAIKLKELKHWDWKNDPYNIEYQLTYLILTNRSNFSLVRKHMKNDYGGLMSMLVCYNAGYGRWIQRRTVAKAMGYPADIWKGGLDKSYTSGESKVIYGRPLWKMVNEYPENVMAKSKKYKPFLY